MLQIRNIRPFRYFPPLLATLLAALAVALIGGTRAGAAEGDTRAGLFLGTTTFSVEGITTSGTTFGGSFGYEFSQDLMWTVAGAFSSTDGEETVVDAAGNPQVVQINATTSEFRTGLLAFFNRTPTSDVIPFVGGGLSLLNYDIDFTGTEVGNTSGTGPGAYFEAGLELRLTRRVTLIPQLTLQGHAIETESGESATLLSGGLVISLRIGV